MSRTRTKTVALLVATFAAVGAVMPMGRIVRAAESAPAAAQPNLILTKADHGKTVTVTVGQTFAVHLEGRMPLTGWEYDEPAGAAAPVRLIGQDFTTAKDATDPAIGTYTFRFKAEAVGEKQIVIRYIYPGGPTVGARAATRLRDEFKVTVKVEPDAQPQTRLDLTPEKPAFAVGESVDLKLTLFNAGPNEISLTLPQIRFLSGMKVVGPNGQAVEPAINAVEIHPKLETQAVRPGETFTTTLTGINLERPGGRFLRHIRFPMDGPGAYKVSMTVAGLTGETEVQVGAPEAAAAVRLARAFLAQNNVQPVNLRAFPVPAPADDWWLVEYTAGQGLAVSPRPCVWVNRNTGQVSKQAPPGAPARM